ncbi:hypothetical protein [Chroococcidiopsis sp.]|uniref:hypothetical protein n=1 Tax=Chroococcidiopsis sp. TaxID=3088168 RepID=UPI003F334247
MTNQSKIFTDRQRDRLSYEAVRTIPIFCLLFLVSCSDRKPPSVFWVGNLDRDGKLDLIIELASHVNVSSLTLFLSSPANDR